LRSSIPIELTWHGIFVQEVFTREDNIPFTVLNVCNKQNTQRKRCYLYSYQLTLQTACPVNIKPKLYAKITFDSA
jgi:hypothetical protein